MRGLVLMFTLHFGDEHPSGDRWFAPDKAKHFFTAAFVQSASFSGLRAVGAGRPRVADRGDGGHVGRQHRKGDLRSAVRRDRERQGSHVGRRGYDRGERRASRRTEPLSREPGGEPLY